MHMAEEKTYVFGEGNNGWNNGWGGIPVSIPLTGFGNGYGYGNGLGYGGGLLGGGFGAAKARRRFLRFSFGGLILWADVVVKFHCGAEDISERQFKRGANALNCAKFWHSLVIFNFP